ncbi:MAG: hypothetical protein J7K48_03945 [Thermococcus sp.]|nr:hypothetical protein [Thermococcus sp.]
MGWKVTKKEIAPSGAGRYWFEDGEGNKAFLIVWSDGTTTLPVVNGMKCESPKILDELQEAIRIIAALEGWGRVPKPETALTTGRITLWAPDEGETPVLATGTDYAALIAPKVVT